MLVNNLNYSIDAVLTRLLPAGLAPASNIGTGVCVLVATADWGPDNQSTSCSSMVDYVSKFGSYAQSGAAETSGYAQAWGYFTGGKKRRISGGGNDLRMIRIVGSTKAKASSTVTDNAGAPGTVGTVTGLYYGAAGNGIQRTIADGDHRVAVPALGALTASGTGGTIASGTVYAVITAVNNRGETIASNEQSVTTSGTTSSVSVPLPALPAGATGFNVYAGSAAGAGHLANGATPVTGASYDLTAIPNVANASPPTANSAATSFHLTITPFDNRAPEVFKNLTPATAAGIVNDATSGSKLVTWTAGASTLLPTPGTAYLSGGDSGLTVQDADYVGTAGLAATGFELAKTIRDANYLICGKMSAAIKTQMKAVGDLIWAQALIGPNDASVTVDAAITEQNLNDWAIGYLYGYQKWLNPISGVIQNILPAGSVAGSRCNGPYWVNSTQTTLNGYQGPVNPISDTDANRLAAAGIIPITDGSVMRKGCNTSTDASINQLEDFQIPVFLAKSLDATVQPLLGEPQVYDPTTGASPFFDDLKEACENLLRTQPKDAVQVFYVVAAYDANLASQNKAKVQCVIRQTGKANQIIVDITEGRTAISTVPQGVNLLTGS